MKHLVKLSFVLTLDLPDNWDEDSIKFRIEESYCSSNYTDALISMAEYERNHSVCNTCAFSEVKWLGKDGGQFDIDNIRILRDKQVQEWCNGGEQ